MRTKRQKLMIASQKIRSLRRQIKQKMHENHHFAQLKVKSTNKKKNPEKLHTKIQCDVMSDDKSSIFLHLQLKLFLANFYESFIEI